MLAEAFTVERILLAKRTLYLRRLETFSEADRAELKLMKVGI